MINENTNESYEDKINYCQDDHSSLSLCNHYKLARPMPQGKRVYFILLQFILLNIVQSTNEVIFGTIVVEYFESLSSEKAAALRILFRGLPLILCLPMGFIADRYFGRAKIIHYSWIFLFIAQLLITYYFIIEALGYIPDKLKKLIYIYFFWGIYILSRFGWHSS